MSIADQLRKEGRKEGLEEGSLAKARSIARNLLKAGLQPAKVAEHTELSLAEVQAIAQEKKASCLTTSAKSI